MLRCATFITSFLIHYKKAFASNWTHIIKKMEDKRSSWNSPFLSIDGRITLINVILSALPTNQLSILHLPRKVENRIESISKIFLLRGGKRSNSSGYNLIKWENICCSKEQNGFGILSLRHFDWALKCKIIWKLPSGQEAKWCSILRAKYLQDRSLKGLLLSSMATVSPFWRFLRLATPSRGPHKLDSP